MQAERLCAGLLEVEGFTDIDPQAPLGGPDGRKDILCRRDGVDWLAAVYFPPTRSNARDVKDKFCHDLEGVERNDRDAFAFFTNQKLTPGERADLVRAASPFTTELYHQERIRTILDSPKGYGLRFEYLRIPMTESEQHSLWSTLGDDITARLTRQEAGLLDLHRKMDLVLERTRRLGQPEPIGHSSMETHPVRRLTQFPTADLYVGDLLWIHRLLSDGTGIPWSNRGRFRTVMTWVGGAGSTPETARFIPPPAEDIERLLEDLVAWWRTTYPDVSGASLDHKIRAVCDFHHRFLSIHPFLDGNGQVARALLQQQLLELTGRHLEAKFTEDPEVYYSALSAADTGDLGELTELVSANIE